MKELPILFSTPMVEALLEGRKKMTRRIMKVQPPSEDSRLFTLQDTTNNERKKYIGWNYWETKDGNTHKLFKPKYQVGDLMYVRETWAKLGCHDCPIDHIDAGTVFKVSEEGSTWPGNWKPGIHLPRNRCRIWLKCTGVRAEKACDIQHKDAIAEGIHKEWDETHYWYKNYNEGVLPTAFKNPLDSFKSLWDKINGEETWNNWVWVYDFEVLSTTGKPTDL